MKLIRRTPRSEPEFMAKLVVTLGALAVYRLGTHLPLAGIDQATLQNLYRSTGSVLAVERISVFALGVTPIISMLLLVEVARLVSSRFNNWASATPANARRVDHYVLIGSLLLAAMQGYGIATALEETRNLVDEPGLQFRLTVMATLVAATALLAWLAALISWLGVGSGVWILLLASYLAGLPSLALATHEAVQSGNMPLAGLVAVLAYILIALTIVAALARTLAKSGMPLDRTLIWPLFIAAIPASGLLIVPGFYPAGPMRDAVAAVLNRGAPLYLAALAVVVFLVSLAQWQRAKREPAVAKPSRPAEDVGASPMVLTALTLAAITVVPELLGTQLGLPMWFDGRMMTAAVAVALAIQDTLRRGQA